MTNSNGNRDDELELIRQLLIMVGNRAESNNQSIDHRQERMDQLTGRVDQLAIAQQNTQVSLDQLATTVNQLATDAEADQAVMMGMLEEMAELRQENRQILNYLIRRERNGNGDEPER